MSMTLSGFNIRRFMYPEDDYVYGCALCDGDNDRVNGVMINHQGKDHPFTIARRYESDPCPNCAGPIEVQDHWGVYINRVAYRMYCSQRCAENHDTLEALRDILPEPE